MSMLAEPRSRQKWSHDPRNTNWSNDKTKFGYQMLTKMGWSEGNGLGLNLSGNVSHIKVNKRGSNAGVGLKKSHEDDWISHQDDFNALLNSLNGNPTSETASPVEKMRASRHRYTKFVKSKDLSNASTDDMACIFGQRGKSSIDVTEEAKDSDLSTTDIAPTEELSIKTVESTLSMNDYFAMKMAALKQKNGAVEHPVCSGNIDPETDEKISTEEVHFGEPVKKKKKKKKEVEEDSVVEEMISAEVCESVKKKRKTKKFADGEDENLAPSPGDGDSKMVMDNSNIDGSNSKVLLEKKKKKKSKDCDDTNPLSISCSESAYDGGNVLDNLHSETIEKKKKKKRKKSEIINGDTPISSSCPNDVNAVNGVDLAVVTEKKKTKKSKKCGGVKNSEENVDLFLDEGLVKKKKRNTHR